MRILAIETVGLRGSVAALNDDEVLIERALDSMQRSAQSLAPGVRDLLAEVGWSPGEVELVTVAEGPGSFTGLRVGITTAKVFAWAAGCPAVGVNTLEAIALQAPELAGRLSVVLDAQRGELFVADFRRGAPEQLNGAHTTRVESRDKWLASLAPGDRVSGPGLEQLLESLPAGIEVISRDTWQPSAGTVGRLGFRLREAATSASAFELAPRYYRATAAEEKLASRES
ncbi:MAG TPA: tRNA (adenosine(37)-N6)-threonylcarbamoyltransferase complex dimerization subunit type 1 TsaB [Pirellulales bacterium]|jgi:tRNA threonylcarbamoyladenosine biosynthesis protein TsaB